MAISGRELTKDYTVEELGEIFIECYGRVKEVAKKIGCSHNAIYNYLDIYPELKDCRKKGSQRYLDRKVETAEEVLDKITDMIEEDTTNASRVAQFILKNDKSSPYYEDKKALEEKMGMTLADQANYSRLQHEEEERNKINGDT